MPVSDFRGPPPVSDFRGPPPVSDVAATGTTMAVGAVLEGADGGGLAALTPAWESKENCRAPMASSTS